MSAGIRWPSKSICLLGLLLAMLTLAPLGRVPPAALATGGAAHTPRPEDIGLTENESGVLPQSSIPSPVGTAAEAVDLVGGNEPAATAPVGAVTTWTYPAAVLWDNGPLVSHPAACSGIDASRLQDSSLGMDTYGFGHQFSYGYSMADDFTISDPGGWNIDTVTFFAYQTGAPMGPSPITGVYLQIWDGPPDNPASNVVWGDLVTNRLLSSTFSGIQRDSESTPCANNRYIFADVAAVGTWLPAGTYWLEWMTDGSASYSGPWAPPITILGQTTTGNALQYTGYWEPALDSGTFTQQGMPFVIEGEVGGSCDPVHDADFSWTPFNPAVGQVVTFNGSAAGDLPITYSWDFGDGSAGVGATVTHTYSSVGVYTVTLMVGNACGSDMALHSLSVFPHYPTYYAFVNQPWDWVEGRCTPDATVQATLRRGGSPLATASTTADGEGFFALEFRDSYGHIDIRAGDEIVLVGGGVDGTLVVVDTIGGIDVAADTVVGQVTGGEFPAQGTVWVNYATHRAFMVRPIAIDAQGRFLADFSSQIDINDDHIAKVVYQDPQGNEVVQVFYPGGLDVRTLISEDRIEGVAAPQTLVRALVADANGPKGTGEAIADETGFYTMRLYDRGYPVDLCLGDRITVTKPGRTRQVDLTMYHISTMQPWAGRIDGTVYGVSLPTEGTEGRVDLWSAAQRRWYTRYIDIGPDGKYGVDFSDLVEMTSADVMRLWVTLPDGTQQAALGWALHVGVSTSDDTVWGFTTVSSTAQITLYRGLENGVPVDVIGTASATADKRGYFSTTIMVGGSPQDIMPSNVVMVRAGEHVKTLFVGLLDLRADVENNALLVFGPAGSVVHIEGRRHGVLREDAPYQEDYVWAESTVAPNGKAVFGPLPFDVQVDDWFDVTCYLLEEGLAFHRLIAVPPDTISIPMAYLPLVFRHAEP